MEVQRDRIHVVSPSPCLHNHKLSKSIKKRKWEKSSLTFASRFGIVKSCIWNLIFFNCKATYISPITLLKYIILEFVMFYNRDIKLAMSRAVSWHTITFFPLPTMGGGQFDTPALQANKIRCICNLATIKIYWKTNHF